MKNTLNCKGNSSSIFRKQPCEWVIHFTEDAISSLTELDRAILNVLIGFKNRGAKIIQVGQGTLAEWVGCCRETVCRSLAKMESLGLLTSIFRLYRTKIYWITDYLFTPKMRQKLGRFFHALLVDPVGIVTYTLHRSSFNLKSYLILSDRILSISDSDKLLIGTNRTGIDFLKKERK